MLDDRQRPQDVQTGTRVVRHFRQIVVWPLQIERDDGTNGASTEALIEQLGGKHWELVEDEIGSSDHPLSERHYREFVGFLPHVQRFLYGDVEGSVRQLGPAQAPLRVYRRTDIRSVSIRLTADSAPVVAEVSHVDLHLFHDVDVIILACEISADGLPLATVQEIMYRFGRAYPPGWTETGEPLHCPHEVAWHDSTGNVLARSDYADRQRYMTAVGRTRAPCFSRHWEMLLEPIVPHGGVRGGPLRFRQIEYYRLPQMAFLTMPRLAELSRSDFVRLTFASGAARALPFSDRYLEDFEKNHCYDRFYYEAPGEGTINTRFLSCGHAFTVIAEGDPASTEDNERGLLGQFRHQYFMLFLIAHFHKAALLMLSDRLVAAIKRLEARQHTSAMRFRAEVYRLQEAFMSFTQRYWIADASHQDQARDLFRLLRRQLDTEQTYRDLRSEIFDSVQYLDSDVLRRQTGSMHRLTAVTILGLIGTVATGFLGMNLIAAAEQPLEDRLKMFGTVLGATTLVILAVVALSRPLTSLFDRISGER
ncbi:MAG: hypothetical protein SFW09_01510 [Hyphomicrobiaceae bacterium]|nr:hypothetical protein [Hyphomicrobiaceae bacterium]